MWNYRVVREEEGRLKIAEVYYNDDNTLMGYCDAEVFSDSAEGIDGLRQQLRWFALALKKPILDKADFFKDNK